MKKCSVIIPVSTLNISDASVEEKRTAKNPDKSGRSQEEFFGEGPDIENCGQEKNAQESRPGERKPSVRCERVASDNICGGPKRKKIHRCQFSAAERKYIVVYGTEQQQQNGTKDD